MDRLLVVTALLAVLSLCVGSNVQGYKRGYEDGAADCHPDTLVQKYNKLLEITDSIARELQEWNNHAIRMRRLIGVPDSTEITLLTKYKNPIDLYALEHMECGGN